jgi:endoglycosylceramidase
MRSCQLAIALLLLLGVVSSVRVDPNNSMFVDQYNRYTVYHGVNAVYKIYPFHPNLVEFSANYSLTDHDLLNLRNWGMNVIRLHAAWEGIEPERGVYNYTYIETLRDIVRKCNKFGIMVLLDAHQDLFLKQFCGEGLPVWAAKRESFPAPLKIKLRYDEAGFPLREDCLKIPFSQFYLTYDIMKLQRDLFTNQRGLLDHLCKVW